MEIIEFRGWALERCRNTAIHVDTKELHEGKKTERTCTQSIMKSDKFNSWKLETYAEVIQKEETRTRERTYNIK